ncbi:MAG: 4Fe-4S dicluster domain-containing protein [Candidatus Omnitrophota bacterium]
MKYPKLRELKEAIKALILGPYTSKFPFKPHEPFERFRGKPQFYEEDCTGCGACAQVCPTGAITFTDDTSGGRAVRKLTYKMDMCIFCGQCQANCLTEKGIMQTKEFDLAAIGSRDHLRQDIEKELVLCEDCGCIVGPADQIRWVAKKLGPLAFSNTSVWVFNMRGKSLTDAVPEAPSKEESELQRSDRMKVLCPKCRRKVVVKS